MRTFASPLKNKATLTKSSGEVAEWSIAAVLKTVVPRGAELREGHFAAPGS